MRKLIVLFALLCATIGIGAIPSTASAASCSVVVGNTYYVPGANLWASDNTLYNCSGVSGVQVAGSGGPGPNGIYVPFAPWQGWHGTITTNAQNLNTQSSYAYTQYNNVFGYGCGSPPFLVSWSFHYRIRNSFGGTWGSWHVASSANHYIC